MTLIVRLNTHTHKPLIQLKQTFNTRRRSTPTHAIGRGCRSQQLKRLARYAGCCPDAGGVVGVSVKAEIIDCRRRLIAGHTLSRAKAGLGAERRACKAFCVQRQQQWIKTFTDAASALDRCNHTTRIIITKIITIIIIIIIIIGDILARPQHDNKRLINLASHFNCTSCCPLL